MKTSNLINGKLKVRAHCFPIPSVAGWKGHLDDCGYWYLLWSLQKSPEELFYQHIAAVKRTDYV
jgi:hypothetical protein